MNPDPPPPQHTDLLCRRCFDGVLLASGTPFPIRFVRDPASGDLVFPLQTSIDPQADYVLFAPDESHDALQLLLTVRPTSPRHDSVCDRWRAYHLHPDSANWARAGIEAARFGPDVLDGASLMRPNPLAAQEPALCKLLNRHPNALAALCRTLTNVTISDPVAVGVDHLGMDARARFGVVRAEWPSPPLTPESAHHVIQALLAGGASPSTPSPGTP